jgi:PmbA protein
VTKIDISAVAENAIKHAKRLGADAAEAYVLKQNGILVSIEHGVISNESALEIAGVGIRIIKEGAVGFSHVDKLEEKKVEQTVENAIHIARASIPDPNNAFPKPSTYKRVGGIHDRSLVNFQVEDAVEMTRDLLDAAVGYDKRVRPDMGGTEIRVEEEALMNTEGVQATAETTLIGVEIYGSATEKGEITSGTEDYGYSHRLDLDVTKIGTTFAERAVQQFGAKKIESFEGTVILDFAPSVELIGSTLVFGARSDNVQRKASPLGEKIGTELAASQLNVTDDGLIERGMMTKAFDDEGSPRKRTPILEKGVLKNLLYNTYTSKKDGTESTGNASRRAVGLFFTPNLPFESAPQLLASNLIIETGNKSKEQLVEEVDKGVLVGRFSGNTELSNGNFSGTVKQGMLIENGEIKHPISGAMISGNSYVLMKNVSGISKEYKTLSLYRAPSARSPMIRAENVKITGK